MEDLADLARLLRELRRREARHRGAPELTYRRIAARTGWSRSVIGAYFAGRILPPTDRFDVLIRLLGATPVEQGLFATTRDLVEEERRHRTDLDGPADPDHPARPWPTRPASGGQPEVWATTPRTEIRQVLLERLSPVRMTAEPDAVEEIVDLCGQSPLAASMVAARGGSPARTPLSQLTRELRESLAGLACAGYDRPEARARAIVAWTYRKLSPQAARLLRLLGIQPGPDLALPAIASLAGAPMQLTRQLLTELIDAHLATEQAPDRFAPHDLVRAYAVELAQTVDSDVDRRAAIDRIAHHYLDTAEAAMHLIQARPRPAGPRSDPAHRPAGVTVTPLADRGSAMAWFAMERAAMLATIRDAGSAGRSTDAWRLALAAETARRPWH